MKGALSKLAKISSISYLEAILTCKSFVGYKYRGERLIERSRSWFPLKFPSG